jgi:ATP-dependent DNA helicase RecG
LEHNGSPLPIFETDEDRLSFAVTIYRHPEFATGGVIKQSDGNEEMILACMREEPSISKKRISEKTGIAARTVDRIVSDLRRRKIIDRQGSNKSGTWIIR